MPAKGLTELMASPGLTSAALLLELLTFVALIALAGFVLRLNQKLNDHEKVCALRWGRLLERLGMSDLKEEG